MPIIDVSGLISNEVGAKNHIREEITRYFANRLGISVSSTTVTFITDNTTNRQGHVMARLYSKSFIGMDSKELNEICDNVVEILEKAGHPYNEAFPIPVLAMRGRYLK